MDLGRVPGDRTLRRREARERIPRSGLLEQTHHADLPVVARGARLDAFRVRVDVHEERAP